jgi:hypothetical protein
MKHLKKGICILLALALLGGTILENSQTAEAQTKPSSLASVVAKSVGKSYPFTAKDMKTSKRMIFGIMAAKLDSYAAYEKVSGSGSSTKEYFLFIGQASSTENAKKSVSSLKKYVSRENESMGNYLSAEGKKLFQSVQIGRKGKWCWMVMVSPSRSVNKKAVKSIKKKM